ncbi:MAG: TonB-dependent receptor, partial [Acidobacteriota bacterium]
NAQGTLLREGRTDARGSFALAELPAGRYALRVVTRGFEPHDASLNVPGAGPSLALTIEMAVARVSSQITVTGSRQAVEDVRNALQFVSVREAREFFHRPQVTLGDALAGSPGILIQQSAHGQVSPFLRGLTGYHTLILVDGVRFNTSLFRSGPNQYLAFIEPSQAGRIEAILGPAGAAYGSDALGGAIQVLTSEPRTGAAGRTEVRGDLSATVASADASGAAQGRIALSRGPAWLLVGFAARRHNDLRAGRGFDSRNVFGRYFGLPRERVRDLLGGRLQDSGFGQHGLHTKLALRLPADQNLTFWYQQSELEGVRSYRELLGGIGRLQARFDPQRLQLLYARYEKQRAGPLDSAAATFSVNSQSDGSLRQGLRATDAITREDNRVDAYGYTAQFSSHLGSRHAQVIGGEAYDERISSRRLVADPLTGARAEQRALYPNGSRYATFGAFAQNTAELLGRRLRVVSGARFTGVRFRTLARDNLQSFRDLSFNAGVLYQAAPWAGISLLAGRGFRAPNVNDLGAVGLNDLGYEIVAEEAIPYGALIGSDAGEAARSSGRPVRKLVPETLWNYEFGARFQARRLYARVHVFDAEFRNPIVRRTLLFPLASVPSALAGMPVTPGQAREGFVPVATALDPRAVKAFVNDGRARYYGTESVLEYQLADRWTAQASYSFLAGRDLAPNRPVRRLPPQQGSLSLRHARNWRQLWIEADAIFAGAQRRLSGGDLDDERIGASRRRADSADFFGGALTRPYLDGAVFTPTGETLPQILERVLPLGAVVNGVRVIDDNTRVPLVLSTSGWVSLELRAGWSLTERLRLSLGVVNLLDRNYRLHGSGLDAPGINAFVGLRYGF